MEPTPDTLPPRVLDWPEAPDSLLALARSRAAGRARPVVGLAGPVGAGKSLLAKRLASAAGHECILSTDDYLPNYDDVPYDHRDLPEHADVATLLANLRALAAGLPTRVPRWSFQTHRREGDRLVLPPPAGPIIIEGIHALHAPILAHLDLAVYIEAGRDIRWERWAHLERTGARGWGVEIAQRFFECVAEPTFQKYEPHYRSAAHAIVQNVSGLPHP